MKINKNIILTASALLPLILDRSGSFNRAGRFRVNFNLNRSFFGPIGQRYYQYGLRDTSGGASGGNIVHYAERVALKNVSVWCNYVRWKQFHDRLLEWMNMGNVPDRNNPAYMTWMKGITKDPFCYLEGEVIPYANLVSVLGNNVNAPTGIASFNPRSPFALPGFSFSPLESGHPQAAKDGAGLQKFVIGAEYALLTNAHSPFPPVYLWNPCLCSRADLQNSDWAGYQKHNKRITKVDTYAMYMAKQCGDFVYKNRSLPESWTSVETVQQKSESGRLGKYAGPMRQFIPK